MLKKCILAIALGLCSSFHNAQSFTITNTTPYKIMLCGFTPDAKELEYSCIEPSDHLTIDEPVCFFSAFIVGESWEQSDIMRPKGLGVNFESNAEIRLKIFSDDLRWTLDYREK